MSRKKVISVFLVLCLLLTSLGLEVRADSINEKYGYSDKVEYVGRNTSKDRSIRSDLQRIWIDAGFLGDGTAFGNKRNVDELRAYANVEKDYKEIVSQIYAFKPGGWLLSGSISEIKPDGKEDKKYWDLSYWNPSDSLISGLAGGSLSEIVEKGQVVISNSGAYYQGFAEFQPLFIFPDSEYVIKYLDEDDNDLFKKFYPGKEELVKESFWTSKVKEYPRYFPGYEPLKTEYTFSLLDEKNEFIIRYKSNLSYEVRHVDENGESIENGKYDFIDNNINIGDKIKLNIDKQKEIEGYNIKELRYKDIEGEEIEFEINDQDKEYVVYVVYDLEEGQEKDLVDYKILYKDEDGNSIKDSLVKQNKIGSIISLEDLYEDVDDFENYTFERLEKDGLEVDHIKLSEDSENNILEAFYKTKIPYSIKYVNEELKDLEDGKYNMKLEDYLYDTIVIGKDKIKNIDGYKFKNFRFNDESNSEEIILKLDSRSKEYTIYLVYESETSKPIEPGKPVEPVDPEAPEENHLNKKDHIQYIQGFVDGSLKPEKKISREETAAIYFRILDPTYRESIRSEDQFYWDVGRSRWSNKHIASLSKGNILKGFQDGSFRPNQAITRAEVIVIAIRLDNTRPEESDSITPFNDIDNHWAKEYIKLASEKGWIKGYEDGSFKPDDLISRAEFVSIINRALSRKVRKEHTLEGIKKYPDLEEGKWYFEDFIEASNSHKYKEDRFEDCSEEWTELVDFDVEF